MNDNPLKILLIEDDAGDARLIQANLQFAHDPQQKMEFVHRERLSTGLIEHGKASFDVVLLDLGLPDTQGLEGVTKTYQHAPSIPIIVLTGNQDKELALQAIRAGAQDYLVKGQIDGELLSRTIRYAIERRRLLAELEKTRQREQNEQEMQFWEKLSNGQDMTVTAQLYGLKSIRKTVPDLFAELVERYNVLLHSAQEQKEFRGENDISGQIRALAERIGVLRGGPRDVVDIHTEALKQISSDMNKKNIAIMSEGRLLVLELMGHLAAFYRNYALGGPGALNSQK